MKIQVHGINIAYDVSGPRDAPAIVLQHALATNRHMWDGAAEVLSEKYRVVRPDARGHGESDAPEGAYSFTDLMKDVLAVMDAEGLEKAHHVGLSMGGMVAQHIGILAPERVESLILVSTACRISQEGRAGWDERLAAVAKGGMETQVGLAIERWFTPSFRETGAPVIDEIANMIRATPPAGFTGWGQAIRDLDITADLAKIDLPVLIIVGRDDPGTPVAAAQEIYDGIRNAHMQIYPEASHQLPLQRAEDFHLSVLDHMEDFYEV